MSNYDKTEIEFYQNLGKIFYAVASSDNYVRDEELNKLQEMVNEQWAPSGLLASKETGRKVIINTFNWLHKDEEYDAGTCYKSFIGFKNNNEELFSDEVVSLILKTAGKIAASFSNLNKSELIMLAKLNIDLKK